MRRAYVSPEGELEVALAAMWCELLGLERVGRDDHFFEIGGHSLLAVRLFALLRERFGVAPPLGAIFSAPTLSALAAEVAKAREGGTPAPLRVALQTARDDARPLFCVHPVGGQIAVYRALAEHLAPLCPVHGLQAPDAAGHAPATDLAALAERHVAEIRLLQPIGPYRLAGWSTGGLFAAAIARLLEDAGEIVEYLGLIDTHALPQAIAQDEDALAGLALRAELAGRGLAMDEAWLSRFLADGRSLAALLALPRADALHYAKLDASSALDPLLFAQLLEHVPKTAAHLALLRAAGDISVRMPAHVPVHRIDAVRDDAHAVRDDAGAYVAGRIDTIAAGHHAMLREPHVATVAACIAAAISAAGDAATDDAALLETSA